MTKLILYNTLTRKKETFKSIKKGQIGIYTCGPTVYNHAHIGNLRAYVASDVLQRYLKYSGNKVKWVMNITDVDDKTIRDSKKAKKTLKSFTRQYEKLFFEDIEKLNIKKSSFFKNPRATEHIKEMQGSIKKLLKKDLAYEKDGSIYFSIEKYIDSGYKYGEFEGINLKGSLDGTTVDLDEYAKDDAKDFVLWKKEKKGEKNWPFKIGKENYSGRPGWHIECSAMSEKYLGVPFDIHTGGVDLIFPHHVNEIAQSKGSTGKDLAKVFIHNEHLLVDKKKMSKSLGNFYTLEDVEKMLKNPLSLRYLYLQSNYRSKLDFTKKSIEGAENALNTIYGVIRRLGRITNTVKNVSGVTSPVDVNKYLKDYRREFEEAMNNDLNSPLALSVLWGLMPIIGSDQSINNFTKDEANQILDFLYDIDQVLGLGFDKKEKIPVQITKLKDDREKSRKDKDFKKADIIRKKILEKGYEIEDTPKGARVKKIK